MNILIAFLEINDFYQPTCLGLGKVANINLNFINYKCIAIVMAYHNLPPNTMTDYDLFLNV